MRVSAGVEAAMDCEFAAGVGRIVREVRPWNSFAVKRQRFPSVSQPTSCALKKDQTDQADDDDPRNHVSHNNVVPKSAACRIGLLQHAAVCDHRRLPGRRFRDKRFVSCGFFNLLKLRVHRRTRDTSMSSFASRRLRIVIYFFSEQRSSKRRRKLTSMALV